MKKPLYADLHNVDRLVDEGLLSNAAARLCSRGIGEPSEGLLSHVKDLFPSAPPPPRLYSLTAPLQVDTAAVMKVVVTAPAWLAPGTPGLRFEHLRQFRGRKPVCNDDVVDALTRVVNRALSLPSYLQRFFCGWRLTPLKKMTKALDIWWLESVIRPLSQSWPPRVPPLLPVFLTICK